MNSDFYVKSISEYSCKQLLLSPPYKPRLTLNQKLKGFLSRSLGRSGKAPDYGLFWTTAILVVGLERVHEKFRDEKVKDTICLFFDRKLKDEDSTKNPVCLDIAMHGYSLIYLNSLKHNNIYQNSIIGLAEYLLEKHIKTSKGVLPYRTRKQDFVYVDTIGMVCPFLARYGKEFQNRDATELAVIQITDFIKYGMDPESGFPYHAYHSETNTKFGLIGWGRGVGWLLYGIVDALEFIPKAHPGYESILFHFHCLVDNVAQYQDNFGYLRWQIIDKSAHIDTSATAMFGYAIARGVSIGILDNQYLLIAQKALNALKKSTNIDGSVYDCSGECMGLGKYSQEFGSFPWSQGPATGLAAILCDKYQEKN